jgi:hypothetical protein
MKQTLKSSPSNNLKIAPIMTNTLDCIEIETGNNPTHAIIWMHGLGADGNDIVPIADELGLYGL